MVLLWKKPSSGKTVISNGEELMGTTNDRHIPQVETIDDGPLGVDRGQFGRLPNVTYPGPPPSMLFGDGDLRRSCSDEF